MIRDEPKWTISASGGLERLQIVSELDTGQCASEDVGWPRRVDFEIPHQLERGIKHSLQGCRNLSRANTFENYEANGDT